MLRLSIISLTTLCLLHLGHGEICFGNKTESKSSKLDWGHVTVRPDAATFWWLYYSNNTKVENFYDKPLLIWLEGGPGLSSSGFANFEMIGPIDLNMNLRAHTWVNEYNVLFIDSPVGTGFSYARKHAFARTNAQIASDLYTTIDCFLKNHSEFRVVPTYIIGHAYGAKIAVEFALEWYKKQETGTIKSNLKGVALGNDWISPVNSVLTWASFLLQTGMVDTEGFRKINEIANNTKTAVDSEKWSNATNLFFMTKKAVFQETGQMDFYNIMRRVPINASQHLMGESVNLYTKANERQELPDSFALYNFMNNRIKSCLELQNKWGEQKHETFVYLREDFMKPVTHIVDRLLKETDLKVSVYTGHLNLVSPSKATLSWVENLKWENITEWKNSSRIPIVVNYISNTNESIVEGYIKEYDKFSFSWIYRSGSLVPLDNPEAALAVVEKLTSS